MRTRDIYILGVVLMALGLSACANRGIGPQGGPKDETPPVVVKETPANGSLNVQEKRIEIVFDEYLQLNDVVNQVLISPPQQRPPEVKNIGKRVTVTFDENTPLLDSTTYTIDFGEAICDLNEKNPLRGYTFSFSTGDEIDTLTMSGILIDAQTLNPMPKICVGIHANWADSAFEKLPFTRVARTDNEGRFTISNIHAGTYRIYALDDVSRDYLYQTGEGLAMHDSLVQPGDSGIFLRYFTEDKQRHYFVRCLREEQHKMNLIFSAPQTALPVFQVPWMDSALVQASANMDTISLWLRDSALISRDTLLFAMTYKMSDSLMQLVDKTDTIRAVYRSVKRGGKAPVALSVKTNIKAGFDYNDSISLQFATPIENGDLSRVHLYMKKDTLCHDLPFRWQWSDSAHLHASIVMEWAFGEQYVLRLDSAAFTDIYGLGNDALKQEMSVKTAEDYSMLIVKVEGMADQPCRVQLLSTQDKVVREAAVENGTATMAYLKPGDYYMRLYVDEDGNEQWTTGDWALKRQPEQMYYYPGKLTLRANWDMEQTFNPLAVPVLEQKPNEIKSKK